MLSSILSYEESSSSLRYIGVISHGVSDDYRDRARLNYSSECLLRRLVSRLWPPFLVPSTAHLCCVAWSEATCLYQVFIRGYTRPGPSPNRLFVFGTNQCESLFALLYLRSAIVFHFWWFTYKYLYPSEYQLPFTRHGGGLCRRPFVYTNKVFAPTTRLRYLHAS